MKTHVNMVGAFEGFVGTCSGFGGKYNPGQQNLQVKSLTQKLQEARQAMERVRATRSQLDQLINQRAEAFGQLSGLATRIINRLGAVQASPRTIEDARSLVRQIWGVPVRSRVPVESEAAEAKRTRSVLQTIYMSRVDHLAKLVQLLRDEPRYQVDDPALTTDALKALVATLQQRNTRVMQATVAWRQAVQTRNLVFYSGTDSMVDMTRLVKMYVKAIFGARSPEYASLTGYAFTKPKS